MNDTSFRDGQVVWAEVPGPFFAARRARPNQVSEWPTPRKEFHLVNDIRIPNRQAGSVNDPRYYGIGQFRYFDALSFSLAELAQASARAASRLRKRRPPSRKWRAPRPGVDTPLWNELANAVEARLGRRGAKAQLARLLGISRQRLHLLIVAKTAYPDAERALLLQVWLQARQLRGELARREAEGGRRGMSSIK